MKIKKITTGFVVQTFDSISGRCESQEFLAGDQVDFEDEEGNSKVEYDLYHNFDMVQPNPSPTFLVGDKVDVDALAGGNSNEFTGTVISVKDGLIFVRDQDDNVWDCEPAHVHSSEE
jgi:hypothetical protein